MTNAASTWRRASPSRHAAAGFRMPTVALDKLCVALRRLNRVVSFADERVRQAAGVDWAVCAASVLPCLAEGLWRGVRPRG